MASKTLSGGIIVGAALIAALVSYLLFSSGVPAAIDGSSTTTSTSTTLDADPVTVYAAPGEIVLGPALLVPTDVTVNDRTLSINYDLHQLAPLLGLTGGVVFIPFQGFIDLTPADAETVYPMAWTAVVGGTEVPGTVANPNARAARFTIPESVAGLPVESARIDSYHVQVPLDQPFVLSQTSPVHEIVPGVTATLVRVSEQATTTIVQVRLAVRDVVNLGSIDVNARGEGASVSVRAAEGGPLWNMTYAGPAPDEFELSLVGSMWFEVVGPWYLDLEVDNDA